MATQRQLQTAAHDHGVNRSHHRFAGVFNCTDECEQMRFLNGFG